MKILKNVKALSPVVASIILIAVTVAVSLAVAVWMGSLTTGQMQTEQLNIIDVRLVKSTSGGTVYIEVANTGGTTVTITDIRIDDVTYASFNGTTGTCNPNLPYDLPKGSTKTFTITYSTWPFKSGVLYYFKVVTAKGNQFGPVQRYGPS